MLHTVDDPGIVWYGGMGHRLLSTDDGVSCYRCGMAAEGSAVQEAIPDCIGPDGGLDHHWTADGSGIGNECAYGDYRASVTGSAAGSTHCTRA